MKNYNKANILLGFIASTFRYKIKELTPPLYKSLVPPHLEHAVQCWLSSILVIKIEKIQRRATKMIPEIRNHS